MHTKYMPRHTNQSDLHNMPNNPTPAVEHDMYVQSNNSSAPDIPPTNEQKLNDDKVLTATPTLVDPSSSPPPLKHAQFGNVN